MQNTNTELISLKLLVNFVQNHPNSSSAETIASVLCSLYNGDRCKVDLSNFRLLDQTNFEYVINVLRLNQSRQ